MEHPVFAKTIGSAGNHVPPDWLDQPVWRERLSSVVFPKNPRSLMKGSRLAYYAAGTRRFCAVVEVIDEEPQPTQGGNADRWPWTLRVRPLVAIPADEHAPTLEQLNFDPLRLRRQSHIKLTDDEYETIIDAIARAARSGAQITADSRDAVLRTYGEVMVQVQQWELALALLWWKVERNDDGPAGDFDTKASQEQIRRLQAAFLKKTAGSVREQVEPHLDTETAANLKAIWDERNRLAHRYLREQDTDGSGFSDGTFGELMELGNRFEASASGVVEALMSGGDYAGPVPGHWPALAERLIGRLERGERIPRDPREQ
jgi:hypothetical protein